MSAAVAFASQDRAELAIDLGLPSDHHLLAVDELYLPDASMEEERCSSNSVSLSSASSSRDSSSTSSSSSDSDWPARASSFSASSTSSAPAALPAQQAPPCPLPPPSTAHSDPAASQSEVSGGCLSSAPFSSDRHLFAFVSRPLLLRSVLSLQLVMHLAFLSAAIYLLCSRAKLLELLAVDSQSAAGVVTLQLPAWLLARSVVSAVLTTRRLVLGTAWCSSTWETMWVAIALASTLVFGVAGLVALEEVSQMGTTMAALWAVVAVLVLLAAAHISLFNIALLLFPLRVLTLSMPVMPLDPWLYYDTPSLPSPRSQRPHQGLTQQQLDTLPVTTCTTLRDDPCAVCMDDVQLGQLQRVLRCGHAYHQQCIDVWLLKRRVCPLCVRAVRPSAKRPSISSETVVVEMADKRRPSSHHVDIDAVPA